MTKGIDQQFRQTLRRRRNARLRKARWNRWRHRLRRLRRAILAPFVIFIAALLAGILFNGIGDAGIILTILSAILAFFILAIYPRTKPLDLEDLHRAPLPELAGMTALWLETQRSMLPREAYESLDLIGYNLDQLSDQLALIPDNTQAAREVRKLVGVHLPALVSSYTSVPETLRGEPNAGSTPHDQISDGLRIIAREIERAMEQIARGELDELAIRGRFLETRYADTLDD